MNWLPPNAALGPRLRISPWRKIALRIWRSAADPTVYGWMDVEASRALEFIHARSNSTGSRITLTHFVGRALAEAYRRHPALNCVMRRGALYPRKTIDIYFTVANDSAGADLAGAAVREADRKTLEGFADALAEPVKKIRTGTSHPYRLLNRIMDLLPGFLIRPALGIASRVLFGMNVYSPLFGLPRDPFGSAMISNIGSLGLDTAFPPLVPLTRVPFLMSICQLKETPIVRDGQIVIGKMLRLGVTLDHRVVDGVPLGPMAQTLKAIFENPEQELEKGLRA